MHKSFFSLTAFDVECFLVAYKKDEHPQGFCTFFLHAVDRSLLVSLKARNSLFKTRKNFTRQVCRRFGGDSSELGFGMIIGRVHFLPVPALNDNRVLREVIAQDSPHGIRIENQFRVLQSVAKFMKDLSVCAPPASCPASIIASDHAGGICF